MTPMTDPQRLEKMVPLLLSWYRAQNRDLPWRRDPKPYHVWLSEIMLQQTRVEAVKPYYARFLQALPTIQALADAPEEQLMKLWEGLGYYSRARSLQKAARQVVEQYGGALPASYEQLLALPGFGEYTAGAVASIAFGIPVPAVDGNVLRVVSRLLEDGADFSKKKEKDRVREMLLQVEPADAPGDLNQAIMELGAMVCLPNGAPRCLECPLREICKAGQAGSTGDYPYKPPKKPRRVEERTVLLVRRGEELLLHRRPPKGLLAGLWELPALEGRADAAGAGQWLWEELGLSAASWEPLAPAKHIFSHVEWRMTGWEVALPQEAPSPLPEGYVWAGREQRQKDYALPSAFAPFLKGEQKEERQA